MSASAGEIWLAGHAAETRRLGYVVSDAARPWQVRLAGDRAVGVHQLGTLPIERLLEQVERPGADTLCQVRRAVHAVAG